MHIPTKDQFTEVQHTQVLTLEGFDRGTSDHTNGTREMQEHEQQMYEGKRVSEQYNIKYKVQPE